MDTIDWKRKVQMIYLSVAVILMFCASLQVVGAFFAGDAGPCRELAVEWTYETSSGKTGTLVPPQILEMKDNEEVSLMTFLPNRIPEGAYLGYYPFHQVGRVYINGELRSKYVGTESLFKTNLPADGVRFLELSPDDGGKVLTATFSSPCGRYAGMIYPFYIGSRQAIYRTVFSPSIFVIICGMFLFFTGIILIGVSMAGIHNRDVLMPYMYLGLSAGYSGAWFVLQMGVCQMICDNTAWLQWIETMTLAIMPLPLMRFVDVCEEGRYRKICNVISVLNLLLIFSVLISPITKLDMLTWIYILHVSILISFVFVIATLLHLRLTDPEAFAGLRWIATSGAIFLFFGVLELVLYYLIPHFETGIFFAVGVLTLLFGGFVFVQRLHLIYQARDQLRIEQSKVQDAMLSNISNAIREPILDIFIKTEEINKISTKEKIRSCAMIANEESMRFLVLLDDIVNFVKLKAGMMEVVKEPYETVHVFKSIIKQAKRHRRIKSVKFFYRISQGMPKMLEGDKGKMINVLRSLLSTAFRYTKEGSVTMEVSYVPTGPRRGNVVIIIRDTGGGLPAKVDRRALFDLNNDFTKANGPELTLSVVGGIIKLLDGTIHWGTSVHEGVEIVMTIPHSIVDPLPIGNVLNDEG